MADSVLGNYFSIDPASTLWGSGQNALVAALPAFQTPGAGYQQNFGSALGLSLLSALMGYQARRSAAQQSLEAADLGQQLLKIQTPEERLGFIKGVDNSMVQERLLGLNTKLAEQELANKLAREQKVNELTTAAEFELGPLGQALLKQKQDQAATQKIGELKALEDFYATPEGQKASARELERIAAQGAARRGFETITPKDFWEKIPAAQKQAFTAAKGQISELRKLADRFEGLNETAAELAITKRVPGSEADLAISSMNTAVPSTARLLGEVGNLAQEEQERLIRATLGGPLSGTQSIAARLRQLADFAENKIATSLEANKIAAEQGGEALLQTLKAGGTTPPPGDEKLRILQELKAEIAAERAKRGQR